MDHEYLDARSLAMHRLIAAKIRIDPALFDKVRTTIRRFREIVCANAQPYLIEWEQVINQGMDAALALATDQSEHAAALRQSSPFCGILSEPERLAFLRRWKCLARARKACLALAVYRDMPFRHFCRLGHEDLGRMAGWVADISESAREIADSLAPNDAAEHYRIRDIATLRGDGSRAGSLAAKRRYRYVTQQVPQLHARIDAHLAGGK